MSNSIATHLPVGFKHFNAMHAYKPESQRVGNWQLSLRVETKPLSSHDRQKLASGLSSGIDAITHALRVNRYRIAGNFRMVLIFVYFVCSIPYTKIKTAKI